MPADPISLSTDDLVRERYKGDSARPFKLRAYYALKPLLPRKSQIALRRAYAAKQARREFPRWPIEPILVERRKDELLAAARSAGAAHAYLADWPDGRRFAAILTHDVEGPAGVENVMRVIEVEQRHGLVSSWNFVAEWYPIPSELFAQIRAAGCEVGLHGIKHDGKLFASRASFDADLAAIHRYLREWDAVGFRSPATHRNAEWMPDLGCLYDSSFPDTDPFEPQAGGCCAIWPFMLDELVELPVTLVQDHTMWEILRHDSLDLWTRKTEWLVANGGLVNVIVHPDYVLTDERLGLYDRFCAYIRAQIDRHCGWHAQPREVAAWWKARSHLKVVGNGWDARIQANDAAGAEVSERARLVFASEQDGKLALEFEPRSVQREP